MSSLKHFCFLLLIFFSSFAGAASKPVVLVTIAPYKYFVERIAGDTVQVALLVPPAASSHTFEPTPRQTLEASRAELWFTMGEPFETRAMNAFKAHNSKMEVVDLRQGVDLIYSLHQCCHQHCHSSKESADLHLWLSPKVAQIQAKTIASKLSQLYPENTQRYSLALDTFVSELQELDQEIGKKLNSLTNRSIMVSHPAYAYFCRDYNLTQLSIEFEGKDPTPQQLTRIVQNARDSQVKTIFTQMQYSSKGAKLIASHLNAKIVELDPYSQDYFTSLKRIALVFSNSR